MRHPRAVGSFYTPVLGLQRSMNADIAELLTPVFPQLSRVLHIQATDGPGIALKCVNPLSGHRPLTLPPLRHGVFCILLSCQLPGDP